MPALTGLRGFGAVWVLLHHWNLFRSGTGQGVHGLAVGYLGVDLFFILSGFVMAYSRHDQFRNPAPGSYVRFARERLTRLLPTNAAVTCLYLLAVLLVPGVRSQWPAATFSASGFVTSFFLVQSWLPLPLGTWISPGWSVSAELGAYAALPLILSGMRRLHSGRTALGVSAICLAAFVAILILHGEHDPNVSVKGGLLRLACEFTAGAALLEAWRRGLRAPSAAATIACVGLLGIAVPIRRPEATFAALPAFALLVLIASQGEGVACRILASAPALFLGRISYSLYLVHWPVLVFWRYFDGFSRPLAANLAVIVLTIGLATLVHHSVEAPSHRLARRLAAAGRPRGATETVTPRLTT